MRGQIIRPKAKPNEPERSPSGCAKRRARRERETQSHCACGLKLKTRRGETRCPTHGQAWPITMSSLELDAEPL